MPPQVQLTPEQIANFQSDPSEWLRQVLSGQFLGANPYIDQLIQTMEGDARRAYETGTVPLQRSELNMGGAYGSALGALAESRASQDFTRGLMGQTAGVRYEDYGAERENMMRALGLLSGETVASRQGLFGARDTDVGAATNIQTANISAAAQRAAANAAAGASRYGADRGYAASRLNAQADYWRNLFNQSQIQRGFGGGPPAPGVTSPTAGWPDPGINRGLDKFAGGDPWNSPGGW